MHKNWVAVVGRELGGLKMEGKEQQQKVHY